MADRMGYIRYSWNCLSPTFVHPNFADEIYKLKCAMDVANGANARVSDRWKDECGVKPTT